MTDAIDSRLVKVSSDLDIYSPVETDDDTIVITDGDTDLRLAAINDRDSLAVLVPTNKDKDPDGRTVKVLQLAVLQAIVGKAFVPSAEVEPVSVESEPLTVTVSVNTDTKSNFWQQYHVALVPDFNPETVAEYKAKTDAIVFQIGQTYELQDEFGIYPYTVTYRLDDMLQLKDKFGAITIRNVHVDDNGEFIRPNLDSTRLYAAGTPSWFYPVDKPDFNVLEENRARMKADLDSDRAGSFAMTRGGLI